MVDLQRRKTQPLHLKEELKQLVDTLTHLKSRMQTKEQLQLSNAIYGGHIYFGTCTLIIIFNIYHQKYTNVSL